MVDPISVEAAGSPYDSVHLVATIDQQFGQV
jgi:hypothetical protein